MPLSHKDENWAYFIDRNGRRFRYILNFLRAGLVLSLPKDASGQEVWATPRGLRAIKTGINTLNPLHAYPNRPSYELRLAECAHRGFSVALPGISNTRIGWDRIGNLPLGELKGHARLLKVSSLSLSALRTLGPAKTYDEDETDGSIVPQSLVVTIREIE